jgi:predicted ATP-dependent serine protease
MTASPIQAPNILKFNEFINQTLQNPSFMMIWGDVGTGKSTCALQLVRTVLLNNFKVFYLYTKQDKPNELFQRILSDLNLEQQEMFIIWQAETFKKQTEIILNWRLQMQSLEQFFGQNNVGLIIVDEITTLYLLEIKQDAKLNTKSEKKPDDINEKLTLQLATLAQLQKQYHIPLLVLNQFTLKKDKEGNMQDIPHGGKIIDYWVETELKFERSTQYSRINCQLLKNMLQIRFPSKWIWNLGDIGFE